MRLILSRKSRATSQYEATWSSSLNGSLDQEMPTVLIFDDLVVRPPHVPPTNCVAVFINKVRRHSDEGVSTMRLQSCPYSDLSWVMVVGVGKKNILYDCSRARIPPLVQPLHTSEWQ